MTRYYYAKYIDSNKLHHNPVLKGREQAYQYIIEMDSVDWDKDHLTLEYDKGTEIKQGICQAICQGICRVKGECKTTYSDGEVTQSFSSTIYLPNTIDYSVEPQSKFADNKLTIIFAIKKNEKPVTRSIPIT